MQIAAQHPKTHRVCAGRNMPEGFLLDGIDLQRTDIAIGHAQCTILIKTHLTDATPSGFNQAAMSTCHAAQSVLIYLLVETTRYRQRIQLFL